MENINEIETVKKRNIYDKWMEAKWRIRKEAESDREMGICCPATLIPETMDILNELRLLGICDLSSENTVTLTIFNVENPDERLVFSCSWMPFGGPVEAFQEDQRWMHNNNFMMKYIYLMALEIQEPAYK
ncbi:MAG: hypothetical protein LBO02_00085 [Holosporaceae bacterium]|jgi:hypothetical protein|nr:hypothetical protein [Holosporaceae bacterium]